IDPLYLEECVNETLIKSNEETITINICPLKLFQNKNQIIKAIVLYETAKRYYSKLSRGEKKYFRNLFRYYPSEIFRSKEGNFISNAKNFKQGFYYHFVVFFLNNQFHREYYPFTYLMLNSFFYDNKLTDYYKNFHVRLTNDFNSVSFVKTANGIYANHDKRIKMLLFSHEDKTIKKEFNEIFPIEKLFNVDVNRIFGISLLIAGEEGKHSLGVGHTGLVILIGDIGNSLEQVLKNTSEHIVINPMGDTYLYENSPVRKIMAGGLLAKFPLIYHVEKLSAYVEKLTEEEYRDVYISPPVLTKENPVDLNIALMKIAEQVNTNETKGYDFFKESCVHVCKNILTTSEQFGLTKRKHSLAKKTALMKNYPISLWAYLMDTFERNKNETPLHREISALWHKFNKVINKYVFLFRYSESEKNKKELKELMDLKLIFPARDDGLTNFNRKRQEETTKRMALFFKEINFKPSEIHKQFLKEVFTVKEYVTISPLKRFEIIINIMESYSSISDKKEILNVFIKLEQSIFIRLDQFFEKTKVYHEYLNKFIKTETFAYHLRSNLDLSMNRKIDEELTPFNLYTYLILHDKVVRNITSFFEKYTAITQNPYDVALTDEQTFFDIERFYLISEQLQNAQINYQSEKTESFETRFYIFYHMWRLEWGLSAELTDVLKRMKILYANDDINIHEEVLNKQKEFSCYYSEKTAKINFPINWGFYFEKLKNNLSYPEKRTQYKRLINWR
ncbi:MAG: hypothetical protein ACD_79C00019G0001, partial [uncultured bacterium]